MYTFLISAVVFYSGTDATLSTLDGRELTGKLHALTGESVVLTTADGQVEIAADQIVRLDRDAASVRHEPNSPVKLELVDGSIVLGNRVTVQGNQVRGSFPSTGEFVVRRDMVRALRWFDHDPPVHEEEFEKVNRQWEKYLAADALSDRIVIRRRRDTDSGVMTDLRVLQGVLHEVTDQSVRFEFKQRNIDVPRKEKVEGVIYYHSAGHPFEPALCTLLGVHGSRIIAQDVRWVDGTIQCRTVVGGDFQFPWEDLRSIDFSQGKIVFLSDLEPESVDWTPFVTAGRSHALLESLYAPRRDRNFDGGPLQLRIEDVTRQFKKGLAIHSRSEIVYRLERQFRRLVALAGIEPTLIPQGNVKLIIMGDGDPLFESSVAGNAEPISLDVDISGIRRLRIIVDFGADLDIADHLILCEGKVTK